MRPIDHADRQANALAVTLSRMAVVFLLLIPSELQAQYRYSTYVYGSSGYVTIDGPSGSPTSMTLPSAINKYPVYNILLLAFWSCASLTSVSIPYSIDSIGAEAFGNCQKLTSIAVDPANYAYAGIGGVLFNKSVTQLIQYPGGLSGNYTMPASVTSLADNAFMYDAKLTGVTMPAGLTSIGLDEFQNSGLTNVVIPASVNSIGQYAFSGCVNLTAITVDPAGTNFSSLNGVLFNKSGTLLIQYPPGLSGSYTVPYGVTNIGNYYSFEACSKLTSVTIPSTVTYIGTNAFLFCSGLTNVFFQGNAPVVGTSAFASAPVTAYYLPGTTGWGTFAAATGLTPVLWDPQAQTADGAFGVRTNRFGFNLTGSTNYMVVVEASTNLVTWVPVSTNSLAAGTSYFSDPQWTNYPGRCYRLRSP